MRSNYLTLLLSLTLFVAVGVSSVNATSVTSVTTFNPLKIAQAILARVATRSHSWIRANIESIDDQAIFINKIRRICTNADTPGNAARNIKSFFLGEVSLKYPQKRASIRAFVDNVIDPAIDQLRALGF